MFCMSLSAQTPHTPHRIDKWDTDTVEDFLVEKLDSVL